ncbi:glycoside hydrolase [Pelomonas sp. HMWF004]|nr:glycoside hydrolase [Pelomonas sp. HMWF004]
MKKHPLLAAALACLLTTQAASAAELPRLVQKDGRHALLVDGKPFLILGAQAHNSSNYPAALQPMWAAANDAQANTVLMPVAWEQVEPEEGRFDFSFVDLLLKQARQQNKRLVLLWFATWKNTSAQYTPTWVKLAPKRFPAMLDADGKPSYCLSPFGTETLKADKRAFVALMTHLKKIDASQRTVLMVQVENEVGTYGLVRDFGTQAQAAFEQPVPAAVLARQKPKLAASGSWREVYGDYADEYFHAWAIARYIGDIAAAGRAVYDLPMYVNNALRNPLDQPPKPWNKDFASGGPTHDVIDIYKAAAPALDIVGPDIYNAESAQIEANLRLFQRADNPLWVPEIGNASGYARWVYAILGKGGLGVAPFGIDYFNYSNFPLGSQSTDKTMVEPFARVYKMFAPLQRQWAQWAFEGRTRGAAEGDDRQPQALEFPGWTAKLSYREWQFGETSWKMTDKLPPGTEQPGGGVAMAQTADDEFIVIGQRTRVRIEPAAGTQGFQLRVEQGRFDAQGRWQMDRVWNGDQVDYGLNLPAEPVMLKVKMARPR